MKHGESKADIRKSVACYFWDEWAAEKQRSLELLLLLLETVPVLKDLPEDRHLAVAKAFEFEVHCPNAPIILEGEESDKFYVLSSGTVAVQIWQGPGQAAKEMKLYTSGQYFGEMGLITGKPRSASIVCKTPVQVWSMSKTNFHDLLGDILDQFIDRGPDEYETQSVQQREEEAFQQQLALITMPSDKELLPLLDKIPDFLSTTPVLRLLSRDNVLDLAKDIDIRAFAEREVISEEGQDVGSFYILFEGQVAIQVDGETGVMQPKAFINLTAFLDNSKTNVSCVAKTSAVAVQISRTVFEDHLAHLKEELAHHAEVAGEAALLEKDTAEKDKKKHIKKKVKKRDSDTGEKSAIKTQHGTEKATDRERGKKGEADKHKVGIRQKDSEAEKHHYEIAHAEHLLKSVALQSIVLKRLKDQLQSSAISGPRLSPAFTANLDGCKHFQLLAENIRENYKSLAGCFVAMRRNESEFVDIGEFSKFIQQKLQLRHLQSQEVTNLFEAVCYPIKGRLTVGNLYKNLAYLSSSSPFDKKGRLTRPALNRRLIEIYGAPKKAFVKEANIDGDTGVVSQSDFLFVTGKAGVTISDADRMFEEMDSLQLGEMSLRAVLKILSGDLTIKEAASYETQRTSFVGQVFGILGVQQDLVAAMTLDLIDYEAFEPINDEFEDPVVLQRDDHRLFKAECVTVANWLRGRTAWSVLTDEQIRFVQATMKREIYAPNTRPMVEGDDSGSMMALYAGEMDVIGKNVFGYERVDRTVSEGEILGEESLLAGEPTAYAAVVGGLNEAVVWILEKDIFDEQIRAMLKARHAKVPHMEELLTSVPLIKELPKEQISEIAKVRMYVYRL
eukprot:GHVQ01004906.1.p1 GENE.GHVQ01004906.1~~GHVQ01004906.1.p1  ORF type:complete len:867 (+),score=122.16 GHVQ01004906.1:75-2603(+)